MPPTKPIGIDPVTGRLTEFIIAAGSGNIIDGGNAMSTYAGGVVIDCGHAT